eukprot:TRINITY_DN15955_c0_g1_i1.p1 TRINITY_DN15955_c0_g1~~TRINITY_DN15955_c0_g1_i1.p1  ORF type:complete len:242 (-),score=40.62 TRINITY_DN15955_c0_g1_i1:583-1308(-)
MKAVITTLSSQIHIAQTGNGHSHLCLEKKQSLCLPSIFGRVSGRHPTAHCKNTIMAYASAQESGDPRVTKISDSIRTIPDFPKPGIMFRDITTLLLDPSAFKDSIDIFVERYRGKGVDVVVGFEARGFIFGPPIALALGCKFVPLRKPKKLPGEVISQEYTLEYGTDKIEMHVGAIQASEKVVLVDDLIATGGTLGAGIKLMERVGAEIVECACVVELPDLKGRDKIGGVPLFVLLGYGGH